jgi:serine/threonine-protein kinase
MRAWRFIAVSAVLIGAGSATLARADEPTVANYDPIRTRLGLQTYYAAIAYSTSTGRYGYSHDWTARINAERVARKNCEATDAKVLVVVGNGFCALAVGDDKTAYGFGYAETDAEAKEIALRECRKRTANCRVAVCVCSVVG